MEVLAIPSTTQGVSNTSANAFSTIAKAFSSQNDLLVQDCVDLLKCGSCLTEFLLSDIVVFIQHKTKSCQRQTSDSPTCKSSTDNNHNLATASSNNNSSNNLECSTCSESFINPKSLLEHAQFTHKINIFIEKSSSASSSGITLKKSSSKLRNVYSADDSTSTLSISNVNDDGKTTSNKTKLTSSNSNEIFIDLIPSNNYTHGSHDSKQSYNITFSSKSSNNQAQPEMIRSFRQSSSSRDSSSNSSSSNGGDTSSTKANENQQGSMMTINDNRGNHMINIESDQISLTFQNENSLSSTSSSSATSSSDSNDYDGEQSKPKHYFAGLLNKTQNKSTNNNYHNNKSESNINNQENFESSATKFDSDNSKNYDDNTANEDKSLVQTSNQSMNCALSDKNTNNLAISDADKRKDKKPNKQSASFLCNVCSAAFNQKIHLTKHSAKHTGIKPFKCTECNYSTVERSHLKVHVRVHTGEKPFKCTYCEYATAQSSTLKIHKKRHHNDVDSLNSSSSNNNSRNGQVFLSIESSNNSNSHHQLLINNESSKDNQIKAEYDQDTQQQMMDQSDEYMTKKKIAVKRHQSKTILKDSRQLNNPKRICSQQMNENESSSSQFNILLNQMQHQPSSSLMSLGEKHLGSTNNNEGAFNMSQAVDNSLLNQLLYPLLNTQFDINNNNSNNSLNNIIANIASSLMYEPLDDERIMKIAEIISLIQTQNQNQNQGNKLESLSQLSCQTIGANPLSLLGAFTSNNYLMNNMNIRIKNETHHSDQMAFDTNQPNQMKSTASKTTANNSTKKSGDQKSSSKKESENKLLGLANIALERETN